MSSPLSTPDDSDRHSGRAPNSSASPAPLTSHRVSPWVSARALGQQHGDRAFGATRSPRVAPYPQAAVDLLGLDEVALGDLRRLHRGRQGAARRSVGGAGRRPVEELGGGQATGADEPDGGPHAVRNARRLTASPRCRCWCRRHHRATPGCRTCRPCRPAPGRSRAASWNTRQLGVDGPAPPASPARRPCRRWLISGSGMSMPWNACTGRTPTPAASSLLAGPDPWAAGVRTDLVCMYIPGTPPGPLASWSVVDLAGLGDHADLGDLAVLAELAGRACRCRVRACTWRSRASPAGCRPRSAPGRGRGGAGAAPPSDATWGAVGKAATAGGGTVSMPSAGQRDRAHARSG